MSRLVSLDEPPRRNPVAALDADALTGRRVVQLLEDGGERRDLRAVTELHTSDDGDICARVATELDWYRWGWSGRAPKHPGGSGPPALGRVSRQDTLAAPQTRQPSSSTTRELPRLDSLLAAVRR